MKWMYEFFYNTPLVPIEWIFGPLTSQLVELVESGRLPPGRAIDLGCGVGKEAIYLASQGFEVTGVDFSPTALKRARRNARKAGVQATFVQDDLTNLQFVSGEFDLLVDIGALYDLDPADRDLYVQNVVPLTHPNTRYFLMGFENKLPPEEVKRRFGRYFGIETLAKETESVFGRQKIIYWLRRKMNSVEDDIM
jgi:cyclopropane fatty-acyl-phospholipid synthase-like methyltransferase